MKGNFSLVIFLINLIIIKQTNSFSLESLLGLQSINEEESNNDLDSDDVILKLKTFFDKYADSVKNKVKSVDKIILPSEDNNVNILCL